LRWSPDGGKLAFEKRDALRQLSVYIIDRTGRKITELSAPGDQLDAPTWKDDRTVLVAAQDRQGWRIWGSGLGRDSVFSPATGYGWRRAQFHDRALYATRTGEVGIWRLSDGKAPTLVLAPPAGETPWTFDGPNIVDVEPVNAAHPRFVRRSLDGTEGVVLGDANGYYADMTGEYGGGFAINPRSGGFAYVSVGNADTDIIMMRLQKGPAAAP
jgi:hypothetical protein